MVAKPTFLTILSLDTIPLTNPAQINTAHGVFNVTNKHPGAVITASGMSHTPYKYVINAQTAFILSVTKIVNKKVPVLLTKNRAYVFQNQMANILKFLKQCPRGKASN